MLTNTETPTLEQEIEKPNFLTKTRFDEFILPDEVLSGIKNAGFVHCTPIQAQVLPISLQGRDVAGQAQTGTGKTAAFLTTLFARLSSLPKKNRSEPSALIVAPTRELATQIFEDAQLLGKFTNFRYSNIIGGIDYVKQANILKRGVDIIIGTPGRIIDYLKQGILKTNNISSLIIDEADRLFDLGFTKDMRYILKKLPHYEKRQSMLFSATISYRVMELTYDYMNLPEFISVTPEEIVVGKVGQSVYHVGTNEKMSLLLGLLERNDWQRVLIFANTKVIVEWIAKKLKGNGLRAEGITGDLPQRKRMRLMENFKKGVTKILVATDVASRGIHVEDISHVFNYDLPQDIDSYVHRIGRTARAGKPGQAISLACENYVLHLEPIEHMLGYKLPVVWPEDDWFKKDKCGHIPLIYKSRNGKDSKPRRDSNGRDRRQDNRSNDRNGLSRKILSSIKFSTEPGGIFGLLPYNNEVEKDESTGVQQKSNTKKKQKKPIHRRYRKKATPAKESDTDKQAVSS